MVEGRVVPWPQESESGDRTVRVLSFLKFPPTQGGVAGQSYWTAHELARSGHQVVVITNAHETNRQERCWLGQDDLARLETDYSGGGSVRLCLASSGVPAHIPASNPFVSKLAGAGLACASDFRPDVLFAHYLEPFAVAADFVAGTIGVPLVVQHAGSDRTRLMAHPSLGPLYRALLRRATCVVAGDDSLLAVGVSRQALFTRAWPPHRPSAFIPGSGPSTLKSLAEQVARDARDEVWLGDEWGSDDPGQVIGVAGKVGTFKGTFDLLRALARLRDAGRPVRLAAVIGGDLLPQVSEEVDRLSLRDGVLRLPFVAPWRMPEFLQGCDIVCVLERDFPVKIHRPRVAVEAMWCGTPTLLSREMFDKAREAMPGLTVGDHTFFAGDPKDEEALGASIADAISDADRLRRLARRAEELASPLGDGDIAGFMTDVFDRALHLAGRSYRRRSMRPVDSAVVARVLKRAMPITAAWAAEEMQTAVDLAGNDVPTPLDIEEWALNAADALIGELRRAGAGGHEATRPRVLAEVARFERYMLWSSLWNGETAAEVGDPLGSCGWGVTHAPPADGERRLVGILHLVVSKNVAIVQFPIAIQSARQALGDEQRVADKDGVEQRVADKDGIAWEMLAQQSRQTIVFVRRGDVYGRAFAVSDGVANLLGECEKPVSIQHAVNVAVRQRLAPSEGGCRDRIGDLMRQRVLVLQGSSFSALSDISSIRPMEDEHDARAALPDVETES
jgi:glycosyltransferase involved in cell wall biosynthesis